MKIAFSWFGWFFISFFFFSSHAITYIFLNFVKNYSLLLIDCYDSVFMAQSRIRSLQWNTTKCWHHPALVLLLDILKIPFPSVDDYGLFCLIVCGSFRRLHIGHSIGLIAGCDHESVLLHTPNLWCFYTMPFSDRQNLCTINSCRLCDYVWISLRRLKYTENNTEKWCFLC